MIVASSASSRGRHVCFVGLPNIVCNLAKRIVAPRP